MFAEAIEAILVDHCTPADVRAVERGGVAKALIDALAGAGFYDLLAPEDAGGGGVGLAELYPIAYLCGRYAMPVPLLQTMAARLFVSRGDSLPADGLLTFAPALVELDGEVRAPHVPGGSVATHVIGSVDGALCLFAVADAVTSSTGIHGSTLASFRWAGGSGKALLLRGDAVELQPLAALLHAGLLAGAMRSAFDLTMQYANDRIQFGKAIGKFQAIQHQLSVMAEHVAASGIAAEAGFAGFPLMPRTAACAAAKSRTSEAAQLVASIAHAVHGAIGVTDEYDLQLHTRRLHEWRMAHGSEMHWNNVLGAGLAEYGGSVADYVREISA
jgi:alkylation response protein AidB-like acyl-CoA dehydrogenase